MNDQTKRHLAAVMFTDLVGYTAILHQDEAQGRAARSRHKQAVTDAVEKNGGTLVQLMGDGSFSVFPGALAAVRAALEIQEALQAPEPLPLRIGIHQGEVAYDDQGILGDAINVASRVQSLAPPGGILVTGKVYDDLKNQRTLTLRPVETAQVKGIGYPVTLYTVESQESISGPRHLTAEPPDDGAWSGPLVGEHSESKSVAHPRPWYRRGRYQVVVGLATAFFAAVVVIIYLRERAPQTASPTSHLGAATAAHSIAVLPFQNMSPNPQDEYFSDGITDEILTALASIRSLQVISRTSVMGYKNTPKNLRQIGEELGVDHVLEGSVRRAGDQVRITAQLIDAKSDKHLWADVYDRRLLDIFAIQRDIAASIATALRLRLSADELQRPESGQTANSLAYEYYLKGKASLDRVLYETGGLADLELAATLFKRAVELDSRYARAHAMLAITYANLRTWGGEISLDSAMTHARTAVSLEPNLPEAHAALGSMHFSAGSLQAARQAWQTAAELNPADAEVPINLMTTYTVGGQLDEALRLAKRAAALDPRRGIYPGGVGAIYVLLGDFASAEHWLQKSIDLQPDNYAAHTGLVLSRIYQGQLREAQTLARRNVSLALDDVYAWVIRGLVEARLGDYEMAAKSFDRVRELAPHAPRIWGPHLATVWQYMLRHDSANALLREAEADWRKELRGAQENWFPQLDLAVIAAARGEKDQAVAWLTEAARRGWLAYADLYVRVHPILDDLRRDARFQRLFEDSKTKVDSMRARVEKEGW